MKDFREIGPFWDLVDPLTVQQAAALIAGVDPESISPDGGYFLDRETGLTCSDGIRHVMAAYLALENAINGQRLKARLYYDAEPRYMAGIDNLKERSYWRGEDVTKIDDGEGNSYIISPVPDWRRTTIRREDLIAWLEASPLRPVFFFPEKDDDNASMRIKGAVFAKLAAAIDSFPGKYPEHGGDWPKLDEDVRPWLAGAFGCSQREAHVFGAIIGEHFGLKAST